MFTLQPVVSYSRKGTLTIYWNGKANCTVLADGVLCYL